MAPRRRLEQAAELIDHGAQLRKLDVAGVWRYGVRAWRGARHGDGFAAAHGVQRGLLSVGEGVEVLLVVVIELCPKRSLTTCRSAPPASSHDAWAWRMPWGVMWTPVSAAFGAGFQTWRLNRDQVIGRELPFAHMAPHAGGDLLR